MMMKTELIRIYDPAEDAEGVLRAGDILSHGGMVAIPTETVYGLAANAYDEAAVKAVEAGDPCLGRTLAAIGEMGGRAFVTADHGNAHRMTDEHGEPFTAHTTNPVPFIVVNYPCTLREGGKLCDIAPTMLKLLNMEQPEEMTGKSIIL